MTDGSLSEKINIAWGPHDVETPRTHEKARRLKTGHVFTQQPDYTTWQRPSRPVGPGFDVRRHARSSSCTKSLESWKTRRGLAHGRSCQTWTNNKRSPRRSRKWIPRTRGHRAHPTVRQHQTRPTVQRKRKSAPTLSSEPFELRWRQGNREEKRRVFCSTNFLRKI